MAGTSSGVSEIEVSGRDVSEHILDLKNILKKLIQVVCDYLLCNPDAIPPVFINDALRILRELRDVKLKNPQNVTTTIVGDVIPIPPGYICPESLKFLYDPVVLACGHTYDRSFAEKWVKEESNQQCPKTGEKLSHTILIPNKIIKDWVVEWCKDRDIQLPANAKEPNAVERKEDRKYWTILVNSLSSSSQLKRKEAAEKLRDLTKNVQQFRDFFTEYRDGVSKLVAELSPSTDNYDSKVQEALIAIVMNICDVDENREKILESPHTMPILIEFLKFGTIETRRKVAVTLFSLSNTNENKLMIGKLGAIKLLIDLIDEGDLEAVKDAASAILVLCFACEKNSSRVIRDEGVKVIVKKMVDSILVDEFLSILVTLSAFENAIEEMVEFGLVPLLLETIRSRATSARNLNNSISILYIIALNDKTKWKELVKEEYVDLLYTQVTKSDNSRMSKMMEFIMDKLDSTDEAITHKLDTTEVDMQPQPR